MLKNQLQKKVVERSLLKDRELKNLLKQIQNSKKVKNGGQRKEFKIQRLVIKKKRRFQIDLLKEIIKKQKKLKNVSLTREKTNVKQNFGNYVQKKKNNSKKVKKNLKQGL